MNTRNAVAHIRQAGFTLVELAIVMIIIGLLIGGVLKGQELIANAQVTATIAQIKGIDAATSTFRDVYDSLPGDVINANVRIPNCGTCPSGDGNGRLNVDPGAAVAGEGLGYFRHLAGADLITGVNSIPVDAAVTAGDEVPEAEVNGASIRVGFVAGAPVGSQGGAAATWRSGHYLTVSGDPATALTGLAAGLVGLTPSQAERIDNKMDDGLPQAGVVRAGGQGTCIAVIGGVTRYNGLVNQADCAVYVRIQG